ncbi:MAG: ketoacyl-ACP synthase III [Candidatus Cloacimonetes bacterium]|jgi:3-oxoacyl-[acyl-carrier-protein] synthase-3|nr:ketoacyl-ACP synthase III [Candidatus Cloacimonadota bacterium]MDD2424022.1 ketoacyl-ACP synthase III [Candidatus Cloacimonadota bacterium]MDD3563960.1 ketoacyl-ACP synthase III [Candidatus Cloacimonadota bacterium]MDD4277440.1 ketoacyl-ACP synthase III [Candidatus Cloacimonadota bacterium]MDY0325696.1 beta-ketoacyl-ACP synthase III [Candidatus Cloacimonadaceae bacterium]
MGLYFAKFSAFGSFAPAKILTNQDLEKIVDTSDEWIRSRTGMVERRIASKEEAASDLAYQAALNAIEASDVKYKEIDLIVVATISGDHPFPSTACLLQHKLGLKGIPAFDVSAGCTGFIYACEVARQFVENGTARNVLVVGVEILTKITNWTDRNTCVLFGDAAGAAVISRAEPTDISRIIDIKLDADGSMGDYLIQMAGGSRLPASHETVDANQHTVYMEGNRIFKSAVKSMYASSDELLKRNNLTSADVDWVIPHQANLRIIEALADKMKVPINKVIINIQKYGNTSSATVPLATDEAIRSKKIRRGDILLLTSFGAGLTWGSVLARY